MIETSEIILRLVLGAFCGAIIGLERERKEWAAGMRTHMLVAVGATLFMLVSSHGFDEVLGHDFIELDPSRVAAQVVSGIGFLGAGTIIFLRQGVVRGLTTASGLWTVAGIGLAIGGGMYIAGVVTTVIAIVILWILQPFEAVVFKRVKRKTLTVILRRSEDSGKVIEKILSEIKIKTFRLDINQEGEPRLQLGSNQVASLKRVTALLCDHPSVVSISWEE